MKKLELVGQKFGKLKVLSEATPLTALRSATGDANANAEKLSSCEVRVLRMAIRRPVDAAEASKDSTPALC
jgi:hypothetical protein